MKFLPIQDADRATDVFRCLKEQNRYYDMYDSGLFAYHCSSREDEWAEHQLAYAFYVKSATIVTESVPQPNKPSSEIVKNASSC